MPKATIRGRDFKALTAAVTKFPSLGSFAGTEKIHLQVTGGKATAATAAVALSEAQVDAEGELPLVALGEREAQSFAAICPDGAKVSITTDVKEVLIRCKAREIVLPFVKGKAVKLPATGKDEIKITKEVAEQLSYLSQIAYNDSTMPQLSCVMLTKDGAAIASNQKAIAALKCPLSMTGHVAIPVMLAKVLRKDDSLFPGPTETTLKSGIATYCVPSPVKAQQGFPVEAITAYGDAERSKIAIVEGAALAAAVMECNSILGSVTRTEIYVGMQITADQILITGDNGSIHFKSKLPLTRYVADDALKVPIEEMLHAVAFFGSQTTIAKGVNGQVYFSFKAGWCMFPRFRPGKK